MKKILSAIAVAASATLMALAAFDQDCVLYYDFETMAEDGYKVENIANPGVMQLSGGNRGFATVVEATPSAKIRQTRMTVPAGDSSHALRNILDDTTKDYRCCTPPEGTDYFATTNFTIELFYKMDGDVTQYRSMFKRQGANNVQVNLGVGGSNNKLTAEVMSGEAEPFNTYKINDPDATNDGQWHHAALVVNQTGETKSMRLYRDYKLIGIQTLATNLTSKLKNNNPKWYLIGLADNYNYNGWLDSVRVTLRALEPQEFLWGEGMSIGRFPCGATIAHMKFDGSINAVDADGGTLLDGVNVVAKDGGTPAAFTNDVPGARIVDGVGGEVLSKNNTQSLYFSASKVSWTNANDIYYLSKTLDGDDRTSWTVEFFMKANSEQAQWARLMSALGGGNWGTWSPYIIEYKTGAKRFALNGSGNKPSLNFGTDVCDGKWHHVAFSFEPNNDRPDPTNSVARVYVDYGEPAVAQTPNIFKYPENMHFVIGGVGGSGETGYVGFIDELRVSAGALTPSQFLRAERAPGLSIFVR
ncbi:MAG: LamG domain-containing protein [Bacteroidaceae bacterium]|nr:LamG domain-containing protein [Bacteroidaceae bacterium]